MSVTQRLDRFQQRHPAAGFPLAVVYKYVDDQGAFLAALLAYYGLVSLFPLLLLLATVLSFVLAGHPQLQQQVLNSAMNEIPVVGPELGEPGRLGGGIGGLVIGIVGSLYGGLGVAQALQNAMNIAWSVPRNNRPNPFQSRGRSLLLLVTAGLAVIGTTVLSAFGGSGFGPSILLIVASLVVNAAVFMFVFRIATSRDVSLRDVAPGAITAAVLWQLLQTFGVVYVKHVVGRASATNSVFAVVLGLIAFLYVTSAVVVLCVEINVVRIDRLHPRSLLTPFTDHVTLTAGDRRAYVIQAKAQRQKGFQEVDVTFDQPVRPGLDGPPPG